MDTKQKDKAYIANTYNRADVMFVSGKGCTLTDENGKTYIDMGSGIGVTALGHAYQPWVDAVTAQANALSHTSNLYYTQPAVELAEILNKRTGMDKVFFSNSGAEANECAIKCARKYAHDKYGEGRSTIIALENSFHGRTMATISATGQDVFHKNFAPFLEGFKFAKANDVADMKAMLDDTVAAVIIELIQGESGVNPLDEDYVCEVAALCKQNGSLLIVDEVQTGNGRTGELYAYMGYGIQPDIVSTAKGLAGGLPMGATMMWGECADTLKAGDHGSTFGGNLLSAAGAVAVMKAIDDELLSSVKRKSELIKSELLPLKKVKSITGKGLMLGIELDGMTAADALTAMREKGLIVLTAKTKLRLLPALNISDEELNAGLQIIKEVLK